MEVIKKTVHYASNIIYILIILYVIVCIPILFKYKPLVVLSGSMQPTLKTGSVIYYKKVSKDELKVGDIITYKTYDNKIISHRIKSIKEGLYETKGDANNVSDPKKIVYSDILGKDSNVIIPYVGYYVKFISENVIIIDFLVVIILVSEFLFSNFETFDIKRNMGGINNDK